MSPGLATPRNDSAGARDGCGAKQGGCVDQEISESICTSQQSMRLLNNISGTGITKDGILAIVCAKLLHGSLSQPKRESEAME